MCKPMVGWPVRVLIRTFASWEDCVTDWVSFPTSVNFQRVVAAVSVCHRFYTIYRTYNSILIVSLLIMHVKDYLFQLLK